MSKTKMMLARQHIQNKEYAQARMVLATVDHPTARDWEVKLNKIAPVQPPMNALPKKLKSLNPSWWQRNKKIILVGAVVVLLIFVGLWALGDSRKAVNAQALTDSTLKAKYIQDQQTCIIRHSDNNAAYEKCMKDHGY